MYNCLEFQSKYGKSRHENHPKIKSVIVHDVDSYLWQQEAKFPWLVHWIERKANTDLTHYKNKQQEGMPPACFKKKESELVLSTRTTCGVSQSGEIFGQQ